MIGPSSFCSQIKKRRKHAGEEKKRRKHAGEEKRRRDMGGEGRREEAGEEHVGKHGNQESKQERMICVLLGIMS